MTQHTQRTHNLEGRDCWCQPEVQRRCGRCRGDGCPMCAGTGWLLTTLAGVDRYEGDAVVVHRTEHEIA